MRSSTRPVALPPWLAPVLLQRDDLRAGPQRVADVHLALEHEPAVEEVAQHALCRARRLADAHVADKVGMDKRRVPARHRGAQRSVERQPQPIATNGLVERGVALGDAKRRRLEALPALQVLEPRTAHRRRRAFTRAHPAASPGSARQPRRAPADDDLRRQLAARLVDHLALELHRSDALGPLEGRDHRARARKLVGPRSESLADDRNLVGMHRPLAIKSEHAHMIDAPPQPFRIPYCQIRPVDGLQAGRASGHQHRLLRMQPTPEPGSPRRPSEATRSA